MARFLSEEWFGEVAAAAGTNEATVCAVLEQVVEGTPYGKVAYRLVVGEHQARLVWPVPSDTAAPDLRISCDWTTAVAIAKGDLSTQRALMEGRLRVKGSTTRLAGLDLAPGLDAVPPAVRASTIY
ncbi:MAG: SCP2 sterol-binding domain-containing protein [Acidimicrobiales bacterium]|nr:SCP2 sterol-binding domain-containing protein [Acidimicrobiales bacterium]